MRWVGIDEAGYGPNLGPLVMTAVTAEGAENSPPDLWADLESRVCRAQASRAADRLWIDDSKEILKHKARGHAQLEAGCLALLEALNPPSYALPSTFDAVLEALSAGTLEDVELTPWLVEGSNLSWPRPESLALFQSWSSPGPLSGGQGPLWRLVSVETVVVGPARFNEGLLRHSSKASVHFEAFGKLIRSVWSRARDGVPTSVRGDKHGGRHFYFEPLQSLFEGTWIDRGPEGPKLSRYTLRSPERRVELSLTPKADRDDGLVALASIVSKAVRERWMDVFNAYWTALIPGLRPTAGYPLDARRFRERIEPSCLERQLSPSHWWREK